MPFGQSFNDTNSAMGQPPTQDPSSFAKPASGGGSDVGGTANLRADYQTQGPNHGSPTAGSASKNALQGDSFNDRGV